MLFAINLKEKDLLRDKLGGAVGSRGNRELISTSQIDLEDSMN